MPYDWEIQKDLKPCPFCGCKKISLEQVGSSRRKIKIQCQGCAVQYVQKTLRLSYEWLEVAMKETWNKRACHD